MCRWLQQLQFVRPEPSCTVVVSERWFLLLCVPSHDAWSLLRVVQFYIQPTRPCLMRYCTVLHCAALRSPENSFCVLTLTVPHPVCALCSFTLTQKDQRGSSGPQIAIGMKLSDNVGGTLQHTTVCRGGCGLVPR